MSREPATAASPEQSAEPLVDLNAKEEPAVVLVSRGSLRVPLVLLAWTCLLLLAPLPTARAQEVAAPELVEIEKQKLEEEVRQLQIENDRSQGLVGLLILLGPTVSTLLAVGGLGLAIWKQASELAAARASSAADAERWRAELQAQQADAATKNEQWKVEFERLLTLDRAERERDRRDRFDARITDLMANVGSDRLDVRLNAVAALGHFIRPDYRDLHPELLAMVVANLRSDPQPQVADLLRGHLARLLSVVAQRDDAAQILGRTLDLTRIDLRRIDASGVTFPREVVVDLYRSDLSLANLSEMRMKGALGGEATLDGARFSRSDLTEARFDGCCATKKPAKFHDATLTSATFKGAKLPGAQLQRARLAGVHFRGADLRGAKFEGAQVADADFRGAVLDERVINSIGKGAHNWRKAHLDDATRHALEAASSSRGSTPSRSVS